MFGWFKKQEVFLSPEVKGIVTENGKPVANLEVTRSVNLYRWQRYAVILLSRTTQGIFTFPKKIYSLNHTE